MAYKSRTEREELTILRILDPRMKLPEEDKRNFLYLKKGFEGEMKFDSLTEKLESDCLILNDLLLELNKSKFQIDSLLIQDKLYLFDVKNLEGDYYYENGEFYYQAGKLTNNPIAQLQRCESLLLQLLQKYGFKLPVESRLVFINPEFTLYQAPKNKPIVHPTQVNALMKKLNSWTGKVNGKHKKLADLLVSMHQVESPYPRVPRYEYKGLRKGVICFSCPSFFLTVNGRKIVCDDCGCAESIDAAILRCVKELKLLFPDLKITTSVVFDWCGGGITENSIRRILHQNFKVLGSGRWLYFE